LTYPKDGDGKLRETVKQLKMENARLKKENSRLFHELQNVMKPVRPRKEHVENRNQQGEKRELTHEEWRQDFVKKFKPK